MVHEVHSSPMTAAVSSTAPATAGSPYELDQFQVIRELGKGSFGIVNEVRRIQNPSEVFAMKVLDKQRIIERNMQEQLKREVITQLKVSHPHVVRMLWYFEQRSNVYCLLEYADGGQFFRLLRTHHGGLPEPRAVGFFADVTRGLAYLHGIRIVHRDVKPENVLLYGQELTAKLGDLGWCVLLTDEEPTRRTFCGTLDYVAPEMLQGEPHGLGVDLWALGVLLYEMLAAKAPFWAASQKEIVQAIGAVRFDMPSSATAAAKEVISSLLRRDAGSRMPAISILQQPWLQIAPLRGDPNLDDTRPNLALQIATPTLDTRVAHRDPNLDDTRPVVRTPDPAQKVVAPSVVKAEPATKQAAAMEGSEGCQEKPAFAFPIGLRRVGGTSHSEAELPLDETMCLKPSSPAADKGGYNAGSLQTSSPNSASSPKSTSEERWPMSLSSVSKKQMVVDSDLLSTVDDSRISVQDIDDQLLSGSSSGAVPWPRKQGISTFGECGYSEGFGGAMPNTPLTAPSLPTGPDDRVVVRTVPQAKMRSSRRAATSLSH